MKTLKYSLAGIFGAGLLLLLGATLPDPNTAFHPNVLIYTNATIQGSALVRSNVSAGAGSFTNGLETISAGAQIRSSNPSPSGDGSLELDYSPVMSYLTAYKRSSATWTPLTLRGSSVYLSPNGTAALAANADGSVSVNGPLSLTGALTAPSVTGTNSGAFGLASSGGWDRFAPATSSSTTPAIDFQGTNRVLNLTISGSTTFSYTNVSGTLIREFMVFTSNTQSTNCALNFPTGTTTNGIVGYATAGKKGTLYFQYNPGFQTNVSYIEGL